MITHREFLTWAVYLQQQWNEPNRTDYYLMQISQVIKQVNSRRGATHRLSREQLKFDWGGPPEQTAEEAKHLWAARLGVKLSDIPVRQADGVRHRN